MWQRRFAGIFLVNLRTRVDRRSRASSELSRLGVSFEIFNAIQGRDNPYAAWFFRNVLRQTAVVSPGAMGCHISHAMIWIQTILDSQIPPDAFVLVMEDDLVWARGITNESIELLLARVPDDANMIKFSVADWNSDLSTLVRKGQVTYVAEGVYLQTGMLGGMLMYAARKSALPTLIGFNYPGNFDNALLPKSYVLIPDAKGVRNDATRNYHFGLCFQGDATSDVQV